MGGLEQAKGKDRHRKPDCLRGQALTQELARRTAYTTSTGLMRIKSTNSPDRAELNQTAHLILEIPADPIDGDSLEPICILAVLAKSRRKVVVNGFIQLGEHATVLRTLFFPKQCYKTCGPKDVAAIIFYPSAFRI